MQSAPISVFVIESHPLMREALSTALEMESGLKVVGETDHKADVLQLAQQLQPDMVLIALDNPGLDGLETLAALRQNLPQTRILALVSNEVLGQEQAALEHGAHRVLTKAAPRDVLLQAIREMGP